MIKLGNYSIEEYPKQNRLVISLPQTNQTITSTIRNLEDRKGKLEDEELLDILINAMRYYQQ